MSKRKPMDKAQARERRNQLLESAAGARLSLTEGVREMRAISGMTQEDFARHREVSARVIKAIELGQGNPTVATLNRIGQFFGLEVGFVPIKRQQIAAALPHADAVSTEVFAQPATVTIDAWTASAIRNEVFKELETVLMSDDFGRIFREGFRSAMREAAETDAIPEHQKPNSEQSQERVFSDAQLPVAPIRNKRKS